MAMDRNSATVLIVGTTGHGKSLLGNRLLRLPPNNDDGFSFRTRDCTRAVTREPEVFSATIDELNLTVIDTPGLFDSETDIAERWLDILKAVLLVGGTINAVIFVAHSRRLNTAAVGFERVRRCIDIELHQIIVVFTHLEDTTEESCQLILREFNSHLTRGTLGLKYIFSDQLASRRVRESKMKEIINFVNDTMRPLTSHIDNTKFRRYTKQFLSAILETFPSEKISLNDLRNSPLIDIAVIENFLENTVIDEILQNRNRSVRSCILI